MMTTAKDIEKAERLLDPTGWALLVALQENARATYAELGRLVGLTPPAVADRIRRLEAEGVITGYHAAVNPAKLGLGLKAIIRFRCAYTCERTLSFAETCPEIIECHSVTGDDCMTMTALVGSVAHLQHLITRLGEYGSSTTVTVLDSPIAQRTITQKSLHAGL
jgi:Lrp/AsnC family leucine-responsive transcriptional regulator